MKTHLRFWSITLFVICLAVGSLLGLSRAHAQDPSEEEQTGSFHRIYLPMIFKGDSAPVGDPDAEVRPISLEESMDWGTTLTRTLTITNSGPVGLEVNLAKIGAQFTPMQMLAKAPQAIPLAPEEKVDAQVWTELAAASDGQSEFFIVFRDQADLRPAYAMHDWEARGEFVLRALRKTADTGQSQALAQMEHFIQQGEAAQIQAHYIVNAMLVKGSAEVVKAMAAQPEVAAIRAVRSHPVPEPIPGQQQPAILDNVEWNIAQIGADQAWRAFGVRGEGIVVANIDTGVRYTHQTLVNQYRGSRGDGSFDHNYNWWDPDMAYQQPTDDDGHGTHTMGTIVGGDGGSHQIGVAPRAQWIAAQGCDNGWCDEADLISAAEWILAPWDLTGDQSTADPTKRPHVVNNSWGGYGGDEWYMSYVDAWRAAGIFPTFAIGNEGESGCGTAGSPGDYPQSFSTGATDTDGISADFSSRGPSMVGAVKPDVSAPGVDVRSAWSSGDSAFYTASGTSMASPHSAGLVALIWSLNPGLIGQVDETAQIIQGSALAIPDSQCGDVGPPNNVYGWGRIDAYQALSQAGGDIPWLAAEPMTSTVPAHSTLPIVITLDASQVKQPGTHRATLWINTNDPNHLRVDVPLTMTVAPHPDMGHLVGTVTSDRPGGMLEGALVEVTAGATGVISGTTDASGGYGPWWLMDGTYDVAVSADGYLADTQRVAFDAGVTTTHDVRLRLDAPRVQVTPDALHVRLVEGRALRQAMTITNLGAGTLTFGITETSQSLGGSAPFVQPQESGHTTILNERKGENTEAMPEGHVGLSSGGPDPFGYTYKDSNEPGGPHYEWIEIAPPAGGMGTEIPLTWIDDGYYWPLPLPFRFNFYGADYTSLAVASNGILYFENGYLGYYNVPIPSYNYGINRFIAHLWDDLVVTPGAIYYQVEADRIIIEYYQVSGYGSPGWGTWEVILFEDGNILFEYQDVTFGDSGDYGRWATVGIQGDETTGLQYSYNSAALSDGLAICFSYPGRSSDCSPYNDVPWLSENPTSGTLLGDSALPVDVTFDATHLSPGVYTATIAILTNDLERKRVAVPVTLTVDACETFVAISPPHQYGFMVAGPFTVTTVISGVTDLGGFEFDMVFDPTILHVEDVTLAPFPGSTGRTVYPVGPVIDNGAGRVAFGAFSAGGASGPSGTGAIATLTLSPQRVGESALDLWNAQTTDTWGHPIPVCMLDGQVTVSECHFADFECDCDVDIVDVMAIAGRWGCQADEDCYDPRYDMDGDGDIDIVDIMQVVPYWGWTCMGAMAFERPTGASLATMAAMRLNPADPGAQVGQPFTVEVMLDSAVALGGFELELSYDPDVVQVEAVAMGDLLGSAGRDVYALGPEIDDQVGKMRFGGFSVGEAPGANGSGVLARITCLAQQDGNPELKLRQAQLSSVSGQPQPLTLPGVE